MKNRIYRCKLPSTYFLLYLLVYKQGLLFLYNYCDMKNTLDRIIKLPTGLINKSEHCRLFFKLVFVPDDCMTRGLHSYSAAGG